MDYPLLFAGQLKAIRSRIAAAASQDKNLHYAICDALNTTRAEMIRQLPGDTSRLIQSFTQSVETSNGHPPFPANSNNALLICDQLLEFLRPLHNDVPANKVPSSISRIAPESRSIFIVHGHDEVNLLRLQRILKDRLNLRPTILMEEASSGQTIIEKFERIAAEAAYCIVLMTPDDAVSGSGHNISQARPNAII